MPPGARAGDRLSFMGVYTLPPRATGDGVFSLLAVQVPGSSR